MARTFLILLFSSWLTVVGPVPGLAAASSPQRTASGAVERISSSVAEGYEKVSGAASKPKSVWANTHYAMGHFRQETDSFIMDLSIVERLLLGIGLGLFSLGTLYVLLFRSSISRTAPRFLFRIALILVMFFSGSLSYMTLTRSLVHKPKPEPVVEETDHFIKVKQRAEGIRKLEQERHKQFDQAIDP